MKTIYIPVSVTDELPQDENYYYTNTGINKCIEQYSKRVWKYGATPAIWLKPIQIPEDKFNEIIKFECWREQQTTGLTR